RRSHARFLAGPHGEMDWIHVDDELFGAVNLLFHTADTAIFGRVTYDMMNSYWPTAGDAPGASVHDVEHSRWLNQASILVVSQTLQEPVARGDRGKAARVIRSVDAIAQAKTQPDADLVAIGSAQLAKSLVQHGLVDDYWLF